MVSIQNNNYYSIGFKNDSFRYIQAPDTIHKYSLNETLNQKDEFRKSLKMARIEKEKSNENKNFLLKLLGISSFVTAFFFLESKKII